MSARAYGAFVLLTAGWIAGAAWAWDLPYGWRMAEAIVWWGLIVMAIATGYYLIQEAPAARASGWLKRDSTINAVLFGVVLAAMLDGVAGWSRLGLEPAGWIALGVAFLHPLAVDLPHRSHHEADPAGSPVPRYVPPACVWIDWTLAAVLASALLLL